VLVPSSDKSQLKRVVLRWYQLLAFPVGTALLVLGLARLLLSAAGACVELSCDDFGRFWYATADWRMHGRSLYAPTPASFSSNGELYSNLNLPHTHLLLVPFTWMPLDVAYVAWLVAGAAAVAATARMVAAETGWRPTWPWLLVFVWWMPTHMQVVTGQIAWLVLLPVGYAWRSARQGRWTRAGLFVGAAVALKPFLAPLAMWLILRRQWRALLFALGAIGVATLAGAAVFGAKAYLEWSEATRAVDWFAQSTNASLWAIAWRWFGDSAGYAPLTWSPLLRTTVIVVAFIAIAGMWYRVAQHNVLDAEWSIAVATSLLLSPLGWVYYGVLLLPSLHFRFPGAAATICWLLPTTALLAGQPSALATLLWGSAATWGLVLAFVHIARSPGRVERPVVRLEAAS